MSTSTPRRREWRREYDADRVASGICTRCLDGEVIPGKQVCRECHGVKVLGDLDYQRRRQEEGICVSCGKERDGKSIIYCQGCRLRYSRRKK